MKFTVGKIIRERRLALGMSQLLFAKKLKVSSQYVANFERGASNPAPKYFRKIARILAMPLWELKAQTIEDFDRYLDEEIK